MTKNTPQKKKRMFGLWMTKKNILIKVPAHPLSSSREFFAEGPKPRRQYIYIYTYILYYIIVLNTGTIWFLNKHWDLMLLCWG